MAEPTIPTPSRASSFRPNPSHRRTALLKDKLELVKVEVGGKARYTIQSLEDALPFDKGLYVFIRAIQLLTHKNEGVIVVGLAGPSGSGKTKFSEKIRSLLPGVAVLPMDMYNDGSKVIDGNFDDPRLTDYDLLLQNLHALREGRAAQTPIYDFKSSQRMGFRTVEVPDSRVVVVEGIYALSPRLRPLLDLRVSITGGVHLDLVKRVLRDVDRSGQAPQDILQQISDTVHPMYKAFIEPDLKTAQIQISNTFNPFSGFLNATYILKSTTLPPREQVTAVMQADHTTRTETETYDIYLLPPGEDRETCQSWLRMRNRDGRYNLMFEEWMSDGPFVISPRVQFEVSVRVLGGLLSLGYEISVIMQRTSEVFTDTALTIKYDVLEGMDTQFVQIQGKDREVVAEAGRRLGLEGTYVRHSYIELVQLHELTSTFTHVTEDLRRKFAVDGEPVLEEGDVHVGSLGRSPPPAEFLSRIAGLETPDDSGGSWSAPLNSRARSAGAAAASPLAIDSAAASGGHVSPFLSLDAAASDGATPHAGSRTSLLSAAINGNGPPTSSSGAADKRREQWPEGCGERMEAAVGRVASKVDALSSREAAAGEQLDSQVQRLVAVQQHMQEQLLQLASGWAGAQAEAARASWAALAAAAGLGACLGALAATVLARVGART